MGLTVSIVTPTFNEIENIEELHARVAEVMRTLADRVDYEHVIIDNASTDGTRDKLREIAQTDDRVRLIFNLRNFGWIRSPVYGLLQADGDCVIPFVADLQDPPELLPQLIDAWLAGAKVVLCVKDRSEESRPMWLVRKMYYRVVGGLSNAKLVRDNTGFGLYDREVIEHLREMGDAYPYFRGLTAELGYTPTLIHYDQPVRKRGITKNNFYDLYDVAWLGITSHSKVPLRLAAMAGFVGSLVSMVVALGYLVYKLFNWYEFALGLAPLVIGLFFFSSVQLLFLGIIGEYVGAIHTQVQHRPLVVEETRIGWSHGPKPVAGTSAPSRNTRDS